MTVDSNKAYPQQFCFKLNKMYGQHSSQPAAPLVALGAGRAIRCVRVQALLKGGGTLGVVGCQH